MATILSTGFEVDTTGGLGFTSTNHGENITIDATDRVHDSKCLLVAGSVSFSIFVLKVIATEIVTGSFYMKHSGVASAAIPIVKTQHATRTMSVNLNINGKLQSQIGTNFAATSPSTVLAAGTWYLIDFRFDTSTTTFKVDYQISDVSGTLLSAATQQTLTSQTAANMTGLQLGQCGAPAFTARFDDARATDQSADYPLGPGTGADGTHPIITDYPHSWIDNAALIQDGMLLGMMTQYTGGADTGQAVIAEGPTKTNRTVHLFHTYYGDINSTGVLDFEKHCQNGSLLGHQAWPMIHPFGFGTTTVHWPAAGLAAFTNGSLDSVLDAWVSVFNTKVGATPFLCRPFREMTNNVTIYGRNGSTVGGINETTSSFIAAWRYIYTYWRTRVPMIRFVWCPDSGPPSDTSLWYPGDGYVDWIATDAYGVTATSFDPAAALTAFSDAYKTGGTLGLSKPLMLAETQISTAAPDRVASFNLYTATMTALPAYKVVTMWDSGPTGTSTVSDTPAGFLAAFQSVVGSPPFTGTIATDSGGGGGGGGGNGGGTVDATSSYLVTTDDIGHSLVLVVTASNTAGSVTVESLPTAIVSDWVDIPGATDQTLLVTEDLIGKQLRLSVRATNTAGQARAYSAPTDIVSEPVVPPPPPQDPSLDFQLIQERFREHGLI